MAVSHHSIRLVGRLLTVLFGLVIMIIGVALSFTIIGAIIGIPLILFGCLLIIRGLF